ncbi:hypothetical protein K1719_022415 [Acacia pycnantha]|nr:hypothetical protein K1719_022415 [Acacia pycnantha]
MLQGINKTTGENGEAELEDAMSDDSLSDNIQNDSDKEDSAPLCVITEDPDRNFPTFSFSDKMKKRLYKAWNKAVIVKLLGRNIGYKLLLSIIQKLWAKKGVLSLINIGMGYFVVKFTNKEDYLNSLTGGPWMIFDHYLTVRPWTPQFNPKRATVDKVAVWKKGGKEKPSGGAGESSRSADGGSRFGVLAVENSVEAVGDTPSQVPASVQTAVVAGEAKNPRLSNSRPGTKEKRIEGTKRQSKNQIRDGESRGKVKGQQSLKRDIGSDGDKRVLPAQEVSEGMHRETLNSAMVPFESKPHDPGEVGQLDGLHGRFWAGPNDLDSANEVMLDASDEDLGGTVVPNSQP